MYSLSYVHSLPFRYGAANGTVGPMAPDDSGSLYSAITTPKRNNSVYVKNCSTEYGLGLYGTKERISAL
jgi:hypothetical protein